jgi:UDP-N-acetyl-D-glucosamine dehydrogenase
MPGYVIDAVRSALSARGIALASAQVLVLGVAYKRDVDDLRESPALTVIELLRSAGAQVSYNDPFFPHVGSGRHYRLDMDSTPLGELGRFDCVVLVTDHSQYDFNQIVADCRLLVDTRNATRGIVSSKIVRC